MRVCEFASLRVCEFAFPPRSYAETVGLEGRFKAEMKQIGPYKFQYEIKLKGKLYNEVKRAEITLTTVAEDLPKDFKFRVSHMIVT